MLVENACRQRHGMRLIWSAWGMDIRQVDRKEGLHRDAIVVAAAIVMIIAPQRRVYN